LPADICQTVAPLREPRFDNKRSRFQIIPEVALWAA
jgi:epoxyqueuosine reductase QueG